MELIFCSGCDVHSHLYSFSFNLNPNWSKQLAEQGEILQYIEDTVDKFHLRPHFNVSIECLGAQWDKTEEQWHVRLKDLATGIEFTRKATIFISAVGGISMPREVRFTLQPAVSESLIDKSILMFSLQVRFDGMDTFKGPVFHTAQWRHDVKYAGKRVVRTC